jgi:hypothetical protein
MDFLFDNFFHLFFLLSVFLPLSFLFFFLLFPDFFFPFFYTFLHSSLDLGFNFALVRSLNGGYKKMAQLSDPGLGPPFQDTKGGRDRCTRVPPRNTAGDKRILIGLVMPPEGILTILGRKR